MKLRNWFSKLLGGGATEPQAGFFGKHPAWPDHVRLGKDSSSLLTDFEVRLYDRGINANIVEGEWEALADDDRLPGFDHLLAYCTPAGMGLARLWPSQDAKGRAAFPICFCLALPPPVHMAHWTWGVAFLERRGALLRQAETQEAVREEVLAANEELHEFLALPLDDPGPQLWPWVSQAGPVTAAFGEAAAAAIPAENVLRAAYQLHADIQAQKALSAPGHAKGAVTNLRLHQYGDDLVSTLRGFLELVCRILGDEANAAPILATAPCRGEWLDLCVGEVQKSFVGGLLARPTAVGYTEDEPFEIDADTLAGLRDLLALPQTEDVGGSPDSAPGDE